MRNNGIVEFVSYKLEKLKCQVYYIVLILTIPSTCRTKTRSHTNNRSRKTDTTRRISKYRNQYTHTIYIPKTTYLKHICHRTMSTETLALSKESNKPRKPLTTYCIFFRIEKNYIYQKVNKGRVDPNDLPPPEQRFDPDNPGFDCPPFPKRYKGVILPKNFYKTLPRGLEWEGKRRQHRKRDYGMPLPELSRTISTNWKTAGTFCFVGISKISKSTSGLLHSTFI